MKDNNSLSNSIGWGCTAALTLSALALTGSCTFLSMSWLIKDNHAPKSLEDSARRVAVTSLLISGLSVMGGIIAGAISESERFDELLTERQSVIYSQAKQIKELEIKQEAYSDTVPELKYWAAIKARDQEISRRGNTIRELREELCWNQKSLKNWETWWDSIYDLAPEYEVIGCRGCKYFVGSKYERRLFVCAMHPYGQRNCGDWEGSSDS